MKKLLPILLIALVIGALFNPFNQVYAATFVCPGAHATAVATPPESVTVAQSSAIFDPPGEWTPDEDVTFAGKLAARSEDTLNWLLCNYEWSNIQQGPENPLQKLWLYVSYFSYSIIGLFILAAAFLMIITRGRSITVRRFIPRFIFIVALILFSFSIVTFLYTFTDYLQGFFINIDNARITTHDLLNVAYNYDQFVGYRHVDAANHKLDESAVMSILLAKVTAATYYTMFIELIIRKIILWFFLLVSPIFPLLLFFKPLRNTAKIWVGELFRWLLYAPLFAIFLRGLVVIWQNYIPLGFNLEMAHQQEIVYPTAVNLLLGGPKASVAANSTVSNVDTFVLYVVALIMLWMVIIVPWILLRIFLDYFNSASLGESALGKYITNPSSPLSPLFRPGSPVGPGGVPPTGPNSPPPASTGLAKTLPITRFRHSPVAEIQQSLQNAQAEERATNIASLGQIAQNTSEIASASQNYGQMIQGRSFEVPDLQTQQINAEVLNLSNLSIPTMKDIAKYETAMMSKSAPGREEVSRMSEMLSRVGGTSSLTSPAEKEKFSQVRERIISEAQKGNAVAKSVITAAQPAVAHGVMPQVNKVQQVNLDDYEEIKTTWIQNYRSLETPAGPDGNPLDRKEWLKSEVARIPQVLDLLMSGDPQTVEKGMQMVSNILPFLLLGGFSKTEIIAYLKAKLEAAKTVFNEVMQVEKSTEEEESKVETTGHKEAQKTMMAHAEIPDTEPAKSDQVKEPAA